MAVIGITATNSCLAAGFVIASKSITHNFAPSNIWAHGALVKLDDYVNGAASVFISEYKDAQGTHSVQFANMFLQNCTSVTFRLEVVNACACVKTVIEYFG